MTDYTIVGTGTGSLHTLRKQQNPAFPVRNYIYISIIASLEIAIKLQKWLVSSTGPVVYLNHGLHSA